MESENHLMPPAEHIAEAEKIERSVTQGERALYLEWMNGRPFSERKTARDIRDGCILTGCFRRYVRGES